MRRDEAAFADLPEVPGYRVIGAEGAGSRGVVFRARDLATQEMVALKVLEPRALVEAAGHGSGSLAAARSSLTRLVERTSRLDSPVIVKPRATAVFEDAGGEQRLALVMEFVEGDSLARALQRNVRFAPRRAARIALDVARALRAAHRAGLVLGSLHPGKIILAEAVPGVPSGARLLGVGRGGKLPEEFEDPQLTGRTSPHVYAASERLAGGPPGEASDVFGLGAILYHLLTGVPPYEAGSLKALKAERAGGPVSWPRPQCGPERSPTFRPRGAADEVPEALVSLVDRMTAADPNARPALDSMLLSALSASSRKRRAPSAAPVSAEGPARRVAPLEAEAGGARRESPPPPESAADRASSAHLEGPGRRDPTLGRASSAYLEGPGRRDLTSGRAARSLRDTLGKPGARVALVGAVAVVFAVGLALALRPPAGGSGDEAVPSGLVRASREEGGLDGARRDAARREGGGGDTKGATGVGEPSSPGATSPSRQASSHPDASGDTRVDSAAAREEEDVLRAVERVLDENPADAEALRSRLTEFSGRGGETGARATRLLARLDRSRRRRGEEELARVLDRAASLEAGGRYGEALEAIRKFPHGRLGGTDASTRAKLEAEAVVGRAARAFGKVEKRATALLARMDFEGARAEYDAFRRSVGVPEWADRAEQAIASIGRLEEDTAAAAARKRAEAEARRLRGEVEQAFAETARLCARFRYSKAEERLDLTFADLERKLGRSPGAAVAGISAADLRELESDRRRLSAYGDLVRMEAAHFRLVAERIRKGEREGLLGLRRSPMQHAIREITEDGLVLTDGEAGSVEFSWSRVPDREAYVLMLDVGGDKDSLEQRLALAVFAHHRGLETERENGLRIAEKLAKSAREKARVRFVRETLSAVPPGI